MDRGDHRSRDDETQEFWSDPHDPYVDYDGYDDDHQPRRRSVLQRLLALLMVVAVSLFLLGGIFELVTFPPLDFLYESGRLSRDPFVQQRRGAVVQISAQRPAGGASGSGFNIDPTGLIITNRHVIQDARVVAVTFDTDVSYHADAIHVSDHLDLAVIVLKHGGQDLPVVELGSGPEPEPGAEIMIIGNPLGLPRVAVRGRVDGYRFRGGLQPPLMEIDAPIHQGHSGSPVFDADGSVIGIVFATTLRSSGRVDLDDTGDTGDDRVGLVIPTAHIEAFLQETGIRR